MLLLFSSVFSTTPHHISFVFPLLTGMSGWRLSWQSATGAWSSVLHRTSSQLHLLPLRVQVVYCPVATHSSSTVNQSPDTHRSSPRRAAVCTVHVVEVSQSAAVCMVGVSQCCHVSVHASGVTWSCMVTGAASNCHLSRPVTKNEH